MAFKPVKRNTIDLKKREVGTSYIGKLSGSKKINTELGWNTVWNFTDDNEKPFSIYGFTSLNFQLENVKVGELCRVTYRGQAKQKNKYGKFPHQALVEVDDEVPNRKVDDEVPNRKDEVYF